jgi:hypothetical protein
MPVTIASTGVLSFRAFAKTDWRFSDIFTGSKLRETSISLTLNEDHPDC